MKLVIEIPDNFNDEINTVSNSVIRKALKNGTPLPKGHGRLKDADNLKNELQAFHDFLISAWGGFKNMPHEDKRVADAILQCIAQIVNDPTIIEADKDCTDCILDGTDACQRGAGRAVDAEVCEDFIGESEGENERF